MKKLSLILCAVTCLLTVTATGCGKDTNNTAAVAESLQTSATEQEAVKPVKHNVVQTSSHELEIIGCAYTLKELVDHSEFIAKVKVTNTSSYVPERGLEVDTMVTPEIIEIYKGEYNNNPLNILGGFMKLEDYINGNKHIDYLADDLKSTSNYTEEELEAEIYDNYINIYTPEPGDTMIFFGSESEESLYKVAYINQGLFLCENGIVENQALQICSEGFIEPLVKDMAEIFSGAQIVPQTREFCSNKECMQIPEEDFVNKLKELCSQ